MLELIPVLKKEEIQKMVCAIAQRISEDYQNNIVMIGVLNGAFIFLADLIRHLTIPVQVDFVSVSSYGSGTSSKGSVRLVKPIEIEVKDKHVLIVEDIVDTGLTVTFLMDYLKSLGPKSIKVCAMIDKHERRQFHVEVDYVCYKAEKGFLIGYGLDYAENYRNLPEIYHLNKP